MSNFPKGKITEALRRAEKEREATVAQTAAYVSAAYGSAPPKPYSAGGFVPGTPRTGRISLEKAYDMLEKESDYIGAFTDDLTDMNGTLTSVSQVGDSPIFLVSDKFGQFVVYLHSKEANSHCTFCVTLASHVARQLQVNSTLWLGSPNEAKLVSAIKRSPTLEMAQYVAALFSGADAPVLTGYINGEADWSNAIDALTIPLTIGLDVTVMVGKPRIGPLIDVSLQFECNLNHGPEVSTETVPVPSGATVTVYDLVTRVVSTSSLASSFCAWCGESITSDYGNLIEGGLTRGNFLTALLLQHFSMCQRCVARRAVDLQRTEEYLKEGAVPDF